MTDQTAFTPRDLHDPIGLCATCRHVRVVSNARGSTFYLCQLAETDPRFVKYPRLPVLRCAGYESAEEAEDPSHPRHAAHRRAAAGMGKDGDSQKDGTSYLVPPEDGDCPVIGAILLAAGQSRRMGRNKMLLPFGSSTVLETIVTEVATCERAREIIVVTGHESDRIAASLASYPVRCVFNPAYARTEMVVSLQVGVQALSAETRAALVVPGDHPRLRREVIRRVIDAHRPGAIVVPSYHMKRGHPILIDRAWWPELLALPETTTLRDFMRTQADHIRYVVVETDSVLKDMDTPEEYDDLIKG